MTTVDQVNNNKSIKRYLNTRNGKTISRSKLSDLALDKFLQFEKSMSTDLALVRTDDFLRDWIPK